MPNNPKNNYISIAKALGIILMVIGHSGCPVSLSKFLYIFHMPLFFICSGFFFKEITDLNSFSSVFQKRVKKLYLPYLKWSIAVLLLHNLFCKLYIMPGTQYSQSDYVRQFVKLVTMTDYELLIRPFWFIKELFYASIIVAFVSMLCHRYFPKIKPEMLLIAALLATIAAKYVSPLPLIGDLSVMTFAIAYFYSGVLFQKYKNHIRMTYPVLILSFLIVVVGVITYSGTVDMRFTTALSTIPYYLLSISGVIMTFCLANKIELLPGKSFWYYIGNHTMPILALNLIALKIGSIIKIWLYDLPIESLSSHTVIYEHNTYFWIFYAIIGTTVPLLIDYIYHRLIIHTKNGAQK